MTPKTFWCLALGTGLALACGTPSPMTTWPYSSWSAKGGADSRGGFDHARQACLAETGTAASPDAVVPESPQENTFVRCMNQSGWCSNDYACEKPGAS